LSNTGITILMFLMAQPQFKENRFVDHLMADERFNILATASNDHSTKFWSRQQVIYIIFSLFKQLLDN